MNEIFDPETVLDEIGGEEELLKEMAEIFLAIYPEDLELIQKAITKGDYEGIRSSAHRMKGSVSNFGKKGAYLAAKELEDAARSNSMGEVNEKFKRLSEQVVSLDQALKAYCSNH